MTRKTKKDPDIAALRRDPVLPVYVRVLADTAARTSDPQWARACAVVGAKLAGTGDT